MRFVQSQESPLDDAGASGETSARYDRRTVALLALIVIVGFVLRIGYLNIVTSRPGFEWSDPDSYATNALLLAGNGSGWRWTFDAVRFMEHGRSYYLPPLYPVFLSVFAMYPGFPETAIVGQIVLSSLSIVALFELGRLLHSSRCGLIAAGTYALWLGNIVSVWSSMQEALHVPLLLLAFVLLGRALAHDKRFVAFGIAGAAFGLAALARSMPIYYLPMACLLIVLVARSRRRAWIQAAGLATGVALIVAPYSVALSLKLGQPTLVDNYGGMHIVRSMRDEPATRPGTFEALELIRRDFMRSPLGFVSTKLAHARSILRLNGGRLLQLYLPAHHRLEALFWKICAHVFLDLAFLVVLTLAPLGFVLSRQRALKALFVLWILTGLVLPCLGDHGGVRMRVPFEPHLIVLAASVFAGRWRRMSPLALGLSTTLALTLVLTLAPQLSRSLRVRGDYGVRWSSPHIPRSTPVLGRAGFSAVPKNGQVTLKVRGEEASTRPARIGVLLDGRKVDEYRLDKDGWQRLRYSWPGSEIVFVELDVTDEVTGEPTRIRVSRRH